MNLPFLTIGRDRIKKKIQTGEIRKIGSVWDFFKKVLIGVCLLFLAGWMWLRPDILKESKDALLRSLLPEAGLKSETGELGGDLEVQSFLRDESEANNNNSKGLVGFFSSIFLSKEEKEKREEQRLYQKISFSPQEILKLFESLPLGSGRTGSGMVVFSNSPTLNSLTVGSSLTLTGNAWVGLGESAGRIVFADKTVDEISFLSARVGIGTETPLAGYLLDVAGNLRVGGSVLIGSVPVVADNNVVLTVDKGVVKYIDTSAWLKDSGSSWILSGDVGTSQLIGVGSTAVFEGGTGIDTSVGTTNKLTLSLDTTELGNLTWGSGSAFTWTFDVGAVDPALYVASGLLGISSANVGIGTTNPSQKLEINGNLLVGSTAYFGSTSYFVNPSGQATLNTTDTINGLSINNASITDAVDITATGNLSVGGTGTFNSTKVGILLDKDSQPGTSGQILSSTGTGVDWIDASSLGIGGSGTTNYLPVWISSSTLGDSIIYQSSGSLYLPGSGIWTSTGNVGIGTTNPTGLFQVGEKKFTVLSNGFVGIGTTSPWEYITLVGDDDADFDISYANDWGAATMHWKRAGGSHANKTLPLGDPTVVNIEGEIYDGSSTYKKIAAMLFEVDGTPSLNNAPGRIIFTTTPSGSTTPIERLIINNQGNVGIGTTDPVSKLDVVGTAWIKGNGTSGLFVNSSGYVGIGTTNPQYNLEVVGTLKTNYLLTPYQHTIVVAKSGGDYTTITSALNSITDNSSTNRYLIKVMPGVYTESVTMKSYVDIIGAGINATVIEGSIFAASYTLLKNVTISLTGARSWIAPYDAMSKGAANPTFIQDVRIYVNSTTGPVYGLLTGTGSFIYADNIVMDFTVAPNNGDGSDIIGHNGGSGYFNNLKVTATVSAGSGTYDDIQLISNAWNVSSTLVNSKVTITNNATSNNTPDKLVGRIATTSWLYLQNVDITYTAANKTAYLMYLENGNYGEIRNTKVSMTLTGGSGNLYGVYATGTASVLVDNCELNLYRYTGGANVYGVYLNNDPSARIADSYLVASVGGSGGVSYGVYAQTASPVLINNTFIATGNFGASSYGFYTSGAPCNAMLSKNAFYGSTKDFYVDSGCSITDVLNVYTTSTINGSLVSTHPDSGGNFYLTGNLGVGTTSAIAKLDVAGTSWLRGGTGNTGLFVDSSGNVGIGTTSPNQSLEVNGRIRMSQWVADGETAVYKSASGDLGVVSSDLRLKKDLEPIKGALDIVSHLNPYKYRSINEPEDGKYRLGLVAQEVMQVIPELSFKFTDLNSGDEYYSVHYDQLPVLLLAAIKEQQEQIDLFRNQGLVATGSGSNLGEDIGQGETLALSGLEVKKEATFSGEIYAESATIKKLRVESIEGLENYILNYLSSLIIPGLYSNDEKVLGVGLGSLGTISGILKEAPEDSSASSGGLLEQAEDWPVVSPGNDVKLDGDLTVYGLTTLAQTTVAGLLTQDGTLVLEEGNSINVLGGTLYLQNRKTGGIDILGGKIVIDVEGNAVFEGNVTVKGTLNVTNLEIARDNELFDLGGVFEATSSAGQAEIPLGKQEVIIKSPFVKSKSLIYLTPVGSTQDKVLYLKKIEEGYFVVAIDSPLNRRILFNWWVIN